MNSEQRVLVWFLILSLPYWVGLIAVPMLLGMSCLGHTGYRLEDSTLLINKQNVLRNDILAVLLLECVIIIYLLKCLTII